MFGGSSGDSEMNGKPCRRIPVIHLVLALLLLGGMMSCQADHKTPTPATTPVTEATTTDVRPTAGFIQVVAGFDGFTGYKLIGLTVDGRIIEKNETSFSQSTDCSKWEGITALAVGGRLDAGLKADGSVIAYFSGSSSYSSAMPLFPSICDTSGWTGITAIACGPDYVVGLRSDGTAVAAGTGEMEAIGLACLDLSTWEDIVALAAGRSQNSMYSWTAGLRANGTVVIAGQDSGKEHFADIGTWSGIVAIAVGDGRLIGLREDGTVTVSGNDDYATSGWTQVTAIAGSDSLVVGLRKDGTVLACGTRIDDPMAKAIASWTGIQSIAAAKGVAVGIQADGTLVGAVYPYLPDSAMARKRFTRSVAEMNEEAKADPDAMPTPIPVQEPDFDFEVKPISLVDYAPEAYQAVSFSMQGIGFPKDRSMSVLGVDRNQNLVTGTYRTQDGVVLGDLGREIGILSPATMTYTCVAQTDPGMNARVLAVDQEYLIWQEQRNQSADSILVENEGQRIYPIHVYIRDSGDDIVFLLDQVNDPVEDTILSDGRLYLIAGSDPVHKSVFRYDIGTRVQSKIMDDSRRLFLYDGRVTWTALSNETRLMDLYQDSDTGPVLLAESVGDPEELSGDVGNEPCYQPDPNHAWSDVPSSLKPLIAGVGSARDAFYSIRDGIPSRIIGKGREPYCFISYALCGRYLAFTASTYADPPAYCNYVFDSESSLLLRVTDPKAGNSCQRYISEGKVFFLDGGSDRMDPTNVQTLYMVDLEKLGQAIQR